MADARPVADAQAPALRRPRRVGRRARAPASATSARSPTSTRVNAPLARRARRAPGAPPSAPRRPTHRPARRDAAERARAREEPRDRPRATSTTASRAVEPDPRSPGRQGLHGPRGAPAVRLRPVAGDQHLRRQRLHPQGQRVRGRVRGVPERRDRQGARRASTRTSSRTAPRLGPNQPGILQPDPTRARGPSSRTPPPCRRARPQRATAARARSPRRRRPRRASGRPAPRRAHARGAAHARRRPDTPTLPDAPGLPGRPACRRRPRRRAATAPQQLRRPTARASSTSCSAHDDPPRSDPRQPGPRRRGHGARDDRRGLPRLQRQQRAAVRPDDRRSRSQLPNGANLVRGNEVRVGRLPHRRHRGHRAGDAARRRASAPSSTLKLDKNARRRPARLGDQDPAALGAGPEVPRAARAGDSRADATATATRCRSRRRACRSSSTRSFCDVRRSRRARRRRTNLDGFGDALAGARPRAQRRDRDAAARCSRCLEPVMRNLADPAHRPGTFFARARPTPARVVAPVARDAGDVVHRDGRHLRGALARPRRAPGDDRQERRRRSTWARESLRDAAAVPGRRSPRSPTTCAAPPRELRASLPTVNRALRAGIARAAPRAVELNRRRSGDTLDARSATLDRAPRRRTPRCAA